MTKAMEMVISGFVSKGGNNLVDYSWEKIKVECNERKLPEQNIETRIYQVTVDAINTFTFNNYKNQDILYVVAESILKGLKDEKENIKAVKMGLEMLESSITDDRCRDFLGTLCTEICKDKNDILYKEINLIQNEQIINDVHEGFKSSEQNVEDMREDIQKGFEMIEQNHKETHRKLEYLVERADNKETHYFSGIRVENRAEEYAKKWDKNVFLNNFNERDENVGVNIKLRELYKEKQLPHYTWKTRNSKRFTDLEDLLREYIVDNDDKKMLLILGQPGIGKSTLITWIMANLIEKKDDFYVFQFASDLKDIDWQGENILQSIFETLNLKNSKLENKVLIIDGFDEIHTSGDRERILNQIYHKLKGMNYLKQFSLIITCRKNYINELEKVECDYITLQTWDEKQISSFCETYGNINMNPVPQSIINNILDNKEILGIPLILYMVLALNISVGENNSLVDIYDQIFSLDGGIYDRCINNLSYDEEHRISRIKKQIHQISQKIAFWIFENEADKAVITKDKYEEICDDIINETGKDNEDIKRDALISNYFKVRHCEGIGTDELQFVHRSIYEYFMAVYFFESLHNLQAKEEMAGKLGELLKYGQLSNQILEFIRYKFHCIKKFNLSDVIREAFNIMLKDGMTYYIGVPCKNAIQREGNIFFNMLKILSLLKISLKKFGNNIIIYLQCNRKDRLYLFEADLGLTDLRGIYLSEADLRKANLRRADLRRAYLRKANLRGTDLRGANLSGANLRRTDLSGAYLSGAYLSGTYLSRANLRRADLRGIDLRAAELNRVDLSEVSLRGADLSEANLRGADLRGADLRATDLRGADLIETNLTGTIFDENQVNLFCEEYDLTNSNIYISEINKIISYDEYCKRK